MSTFYGRTREHLRRAAARHYVTADGGEEPNVAPLLATVWHYFRGWDSEAIRNVHDIGTTQWKSLIPADTRPPIDLNREKMERLRPQLQKLRYDESKYGSYLEQLGVKYPPEE